MDLITLALATAITCTPETNDKLIGLWETTNVSRGGIGHNIELRKNGSYTLAIIVQVDLRYDVKDGRIYISHNKGEPIDYNKGAKINITKSEFTLTGDNGEIETKIKEQPSKEKTIIGKYKYRHYTGAIAYEKYTSDGRIKLRIPKASFSGCFSTYRNSIRFKDEDDNKKTLNVEYNILDNILYLKDPKETKSYNFVSEGVWYESKKIDNIKPK